MAPCALPFLTCLEDQFPSLHKPFDPLFELLCKQLHSFPIQSYLWMSECQVSMGTCFNTVSEGVNSPRTLKSSNVDLAIIKRYLLVYNGMRRWQAAQIWEYRMYCTTGNSQFTHNYYVSPHSFYLEVISGWRQSEVRMDVEMEPQGVVPPPGGFDLEVSGYIEI